MKVTKHGKIERLPHARSRLCCLILSNDSNSNGGGGSKSQASVTFLQCHLTSEWQKQLIWEGVWWQRLAGGGER